MSVGKIAVRYARALFEASMDMNKLARIRDDMLVILSLDRKIPEFRDLLESPVMSAAQKKEVFSLIFKNELDDLSLNFIFLLTDNKREVYIASVSRVFLDMYKQKEGIKSAVVTTAGKLEDSTAKSIKKTLEEYYKCNIELEAQINPEIIGGFVLRVEDQQLDASVVSQLREIKKGLLQSVKS
jgi:F-type H+-transporting ATPase subunit delta